MTESKRYRRIVSHACLSQRKAASEHRLKYYMTISHNERLQQFDDRFRVSFDPQPDGNCQFYAVSEQLRDFGIHRSPEALRNEVVSFFSDSSNNHFIQNLQPFVPGNWLHYVSDMARDGTHGDHITLHVISLLYNVQFLILSTLGTHATQLVSWGGDLRDPSMPLIVLGHIAEDHGEHYVCLQSETNVIRELLVQINSASSCIVGDTQSDQSNASGTDLQPSGNRGQLGGDDLVNDTINGNSQLNAGDADDPLCRHHSQVDGSDVNHNPNDHLSDEPEAEADNCTDDSYGNGYPDIVFNSPLTGYELPHLALNLIVDYACAIDISSVFRLGAVNKYFKQYVGKKRNHRIYLNDIVFQLLFGHSDRNVKLHISINRLIRILGKDHGIVIELKAVFQNPRWFTAWLCLNPLGLGWYEVCNVYWRRK